jgi:hypothetical protein
MDPSLEEAQGLRIAVEGCVSLRWLFVIIDLTFDFRAMVLWMQYMPRWRRLARLEVGKGLICSLSAGTFRYEYFVAMQQKKAAENHRQFVMLLT